MGINVGPNNDEPELWDDLSFDQDINCDVIFRHFSESEFDADFSVLLSALSSCCCFFMLNHCLKHVLRIVCGKC